MSSIDFEKDQREDLGAVNEAKNLSDQVVKLQKLEDNVVSKEEELKELKRKRVERNQKKGRINIGRSYSYNDAGNEYLHIKISGWIFSRSETRIWCFNS